MSREESTDPGAAVRLAAPRDAVGIAEVHVRTWQAAYRGMLPDQLLDDLSADRRVAAWRQSIEMSEPVLVVDRAGSVAGFASIGPSRDADAASDGGELYAIYVDPNAWGSGLGRALMDRSVAELRRRGFRYATLWVLEANDRARRFYERSGWSADGARKTEQARGTTLREVRYRRSL